MFFNDFCSEIHVGDTDKRSKRYRWNIYKSYSGQVLGWGKLCTGNLLNMYNGWMNDVIVLKMPGFVRI